MSDQGSDYPPSEATDLTPEPSPEWPPDESTEPVPAVWEDFIDIFFAPTAVFERRRGWSAWPVLLVLTVVLVLLFVGWQRTLGPVLDLEMQRAAGEAMAQNPDQIDQMRSVGRIFGVIGLAVAFPLGVVLMTLLAWALARLFGAAAGFATVLGVATYSQVVRVLQYVAGLLQSFVLDVNGMDSIHDISLSLARFLDQPEASAVMVTVASRVDVFTLWATALIAIGLRVATGLSRGSAWAVAILVWLIAAVPAVLGALMQG